MTVVLNEGRSATNFALLKDKYKTSLKKNCSTWIGLQFYKYFTTWSIQHFSPHRPSFLANLAEKPTPALHRTRSTLCGLWRKSYGRHRQPPPPAQWRQRETGSLFCRTWTPTTCRRFHDRKKSALNRLWTCSTMARGQRYNACGGTRRIGESRVGLKKQWMM